MFDCDIQIRLLMLQCETPIDGVACVWKVHILVQRSPEPVPNISHTDDLSAFRILSRSVKTFVSCDFERPVPRFICLFWNSPYFALVLKRAGLADLWQPARIMLFAEKRNAIRYQVG